MSPTDSETQRLNNLMDVLKTRSGEDYKRVQEQLWAQRNVTLEDIRRVVQPFADAFDIHDAAAAGDVAAIEHLLRRNPDLVHAKLSDSKPTPLHKASTQAAVELLAAYGAEIDAPGWMGETPLHTAVAEGNLDVAAALIGHGADVNFPREYYLLPPVQFTCLAQAPTQDHCRLVRLLVEEGADLEQKNEWGKTALLEAVSRNAPAIVAAMIEEGAQIDACDNDGQTALHLAAASTLSADKFAPEVLNLLIENGATVDAVDPAGNTPLHLAARVCNGPAVRILLAARADLLVKNKKGETPAAVASKAGWRDLAEHLAAVQPVVVAPVAAEFIVAHSRYNEAITVGREGVLALWRIDNGRPVLAAQIETGYKGFLAVQPSPDGNSIMVVPRAAFIETRRWMDLKLDKRVKLDMPYDAFRRIQTGDVSAAISPDGRFLMLGVDEKAMAVLIEAVRGVELYVFHSKASGVGPVAFSEQSLRSAVAWQGDGPAGIGVFEYETRRKINTLAGDEDIDAIGDDCEAYQYVSDIRFSPDGKRVAFLTRADDMNNERDSSWPHAVAVYNVETRTRLWQKGLDGVALPPEASSDAALARRLLSKGPLLWHKDTLLAGLSTGKIVALSAAFGTSIWETDTGTGSPISSFALAPDGRHIWYVTVNGDVGFVIRS